MSYQDDLKKLREEKKKGCVAFTIMASVTYYAVNGIEKGTPGETNVSRALDSMYKTSKKIRCVSKDSYTIVNPKTYAHYVYFEENIKKVFNVLDSTGTIIMEDIISLMKYDSNYNNRNWTCCERKILGYLFDNKTINKLDESIELFVIKRPCLLCVPLVSRAYYLDEDLYIKFDFYKHEMVGFNTMKIIKI